MTSASGGSRGRGNDASGGDFARSAGFAAAKGAGLIAAAVIAGIVLLQVVDDGSSGPVSANDDDTPADTTTTSEPVDTSPTTGGNDTPERAHEEVRVLVLNGGAPSGSAGNMSDQLRAVGYVNQPVQAGDDDQDREGNAVMCNEGFDREAETLAIAVGPGTQIVPMREPPPPDSDQADCVVIVGAPTT
jgi:hypothetical protein